MPGAPPARPPEESAPVVAPEDVQPEPQLEAEPEPVAEAAPTPAPSDQQAPVTLAPDTPEDAADPLSTEVSAPVAPGEAEPEEAETGSDQSATTQPVVEGVTVPAGSEFARPLPETDPALPETGTAPEAASAPVIEQPTDAPPLGTTDTTPGAKPELDLAVPANPTAPDEAADQPDVASADQPPSPQGAVLAPDAPAKEPALETVDLPPPPPLTPEEEALVETAPALEPEPESAVLPADSPLDPTEPLPDAAETAEPLAPVDRPETGFAGDVDGVTVGRLPRIGDPPADQDEAAAAEDAADLPPIERYASAFSNPEGKPTFAIILVDLGDPALDRAALAALPFPVTFALDPTRPDVADLAAPYLAAGHEVVMLATGIPEGATAADLEVTFGAHAAALPQAVAVLDLPEGGFQNDRPLATQVIPVIKGQGRGLLTFDTGLNPADQVASREELPAATVFRRLDSEDESAMTIRRYLDRAAFKAAQEGRVAVVGQARQETIAALLEWSIEGRAAAVALAPVTAVMAVR